MDLIKRITVNGTEYQLVDETALHEEDKTEILALIQTGSTESTNEIPDYWLTALDAGAEAINTALCTAGANKSAFLFYSDAHWNYGSQMSPKLLKYLYEHTGITKTIFGGDIVNDEASDYDTMEYLWQWRNMLKGLPNHHSVVGNHDDGNSTNNLFSEQYVYGYLLAPEETPDIVRGDEGMYYYIDNSPEKTRYLYLDTAYKGMTSKQQEFIKQALISTPNGWHIVVVSHIWYYPDYDQYSVRPIPIGGIDTNASIVTAMLDAYNSRTGDYADCGGWVEFCIGGHVHRDYDGTTTTGIPIILVETDSMHLRGSYTYTAGTASEASVNGIIADYGNRKIYVVRIGRGESREVEITNYVVSYTNLIPTATDYNGDVIGFVENSRYSSSSSAFVTQNGWDSVGFMPCSQGDVIRFANMTIQPHTESVNSDRGGIQWWSKDKAYISMATLKCSDTNNWSSYLSPKFDANGNVIEITVPTTSEYANVGYFCVTCQDVNASSIITINEPIE